jgi:hypothetical protein
MTRLRFTLAQLMAIVLYLGFGFAALRNADFWASATYTVAFLMISVAPLGALARKGRARMVWAGFAVFGWAPLLVGALPHLYVRSFGLIPSPRLLTERGFDYLLPYLWTPRGIETSHAQVFYSLDIILFGLLGAVLGRLLAVKDERPNP